MRTDTILIPVIDGELADPDATEEMVLPWLLPPVTVRYRPATRGRLARRWALVRRSPFAAHLRSSASAAYWVGVVLAGIFLALFVAVETRGSYLDWSGLHSIPTGGLPR